MSDLGFEPAFPQHESPGNYAGMTLRDYFAAQAPFTIADAVIAADMEYSAPSVEVAVARVLADDAKRAAAMNTLVALKYEYADTMLEARNK